MSTARQALQRALPAEDTARTQSAGRAEPGTVNAQERRAGAGRAGDSGAEPPAAGGPGPGPRQGTLGPVSTAQCPQCATCVLGEEANRARLPLL